MSDAFNFAGGGGGAPQPDPTGAPAAKPLPPGGRHAFGLPAGSIRALLAFMVLGLIWGLMVLQKEVPLYLQYLMFMILGHYFAAHHRSIKPIDQREKSPLFLPRGVIRTLIFLGFFGVLGGVVFLNRDHLKTDVSLDTDELKQRYLPLLLVIFFFGGLIVARVGGMIGGGAQPGWYQDIQAWLVLMAALGMAIVVIIELVLNPSMATQDKEIRLPPHLDQILAAIVGFYFGARS